MLLPHLARAEGVELARVVTQTSLSATNARRKFGFAEASTDPDDILSDPTIDALFVVTRHSTHAELACRGLAAGKAVFVEKPLALSFEELDRVLDVVATTGNDRLMVGFNRRFAPLLVDLKSRFGSPADGSLVRYLVNSGALARGSWYRQSDLEGSRFEGEGGHFIDTVSWWLSALPTEVTAMTTKDADDLQVTDPLRRRLAGDDHLPHQRRPTVPEGDLRGLRRRPQRTPGQLPSGYGLAGPSATDAAGLRWCGQGPGPSAGPVPRRRAHGCADADPDRVPRDDHPGHARGQAQSGVRRSRTPVSPSDRT